jgi:protein-tyrosine phosphatase
MGQNSSKHGKTKKSKISSFNHINNNNNNNKISKEKSKNSDKPDNNKDNNTNKPVNVSLSTTKCKYCNKNYIPNKVLRSHLFYCVDCYLKKKNFKYQADLEYHTELEFQEIIPEKLYLGNNEAAKNLEILKKNNITSILICGYFLSEFYPNEFIYKTLEFEDNEFEIITYALVKGIDFIDKNKCVFVHCRKGVSRSSSIVISYLMFHYKKTFDEAYDFVLKKKNNIQPNDNFIKQLKEFGDMIKVCNYDIKMIREFCINFTNKKYGQKTEKNNEQ